MPSDAGPRKRIRHDGFGSGRGYCPRKLDGQGQGGEGMIGRPHPANYRKSTALKLASLAPLSSSSSSVSP